jgi:RNA polymerase sigma factor (sigma-70 family)
MIELKASTNSCSDTVTPEIPDPTPVTVTDNLGVGKLLHNLDQSIIGYLRCLLNSQPLLRSDWETWDFFQELSSRYLLRLSSKKKKNPANDSHEAALLKRLAKHLFVDQLRRIRAQKRDILRMRQFPEAALDSTQVHESSHIDRMVQLETLEAVRKKLNEEEWEILRLHSEGHGWVEMAAALGRKPSAVRMQFNRVMARLANSLKI